jgi:transcriptional regulator with XRE-family HTH domain
MDETTRTSGSDLKPKIARLVEEKGWNQEDFARLAQLNRQTVRDILCQVGDRKLHNATVSACARALGLTVSELRDLPLPKLLPRMNLAAPQPTTGGADEHLRRLHEMATQPELRSWLERNPERARRFNQADIDELLSLQGTGGPLTAFGIDHFVDLMERRKKLIAMVHAVAGTDYLDLLEQFVSLLHEKIQPYRDRL